MKTNLKVLASAAMLTLGTNAYAGFIDTFDTAQGEYEDRNVSDGLYVGGAVGGGVDPTILGGERDLFVKTLTTNSSDPLDANNNASTNVDAGIFNLSIDTGASGTAIIQWDGASDANKLLIDPTGLGSVDLYADGSNAIVADINYSDLGFEFVITAWQSATDFTSIFLSSNEVSPYQDPGVAGTPIPFGAFQNCAAAIVFCSDADGVDLHFLSALEVVFDPLGDRGSFDLSLSALNTVPEPSTIGLLGIGLVATGFAGFRRRKSQS